jgi:hypothetical protein
MYEVTQKELTPQEIFDLQMRTQKAILSRKQEFKDIKKKFAELVINTAVLFNTIALEITKETKPTSGMCASAVRHSLDSFRDLARMDEELYEEAIDTLYKKYHEEPKEDGQHKEIPLQ